MLIVGFIIKYYLIILGVLTSSYFLGLLFLRNFIFNNTLEKVFLASVFGLGTWSMIIFALGSAELLFKEVIYVLNIILIIIILSKKDIRNSLKYHWLLNKDLLKDVGIIFTLLVIIYPIFLLFLYPPIAWDSISAHLSVSKIYATSHELILTSYLRNPVFNQLTDLLFTGMLLLADDIAAQSISWVSNFLLVLGIYTMSVRFFNRSVGIISLAFWLSAPLVMHLSSVAYIDINLTLFTFAAIYSGFVFLLNDTTNKWIVLSAIFMGFAIGSKYSALIVLCLFLVVLNIYLFKSKSFKELISFNTTFGLTAILISLPWFIRNYYYSGNPVFPFFSGVFGIGKLWNQEDYNGQMQDLIATHGLQKNVINLFDLPHSLSFYPEKFHLEAPFTPIFFIGLLIFLTVPKKNKSILLMTFLWGSYLISWFYSAQIPRYLIIVWPLICITFGWALDFWINSLTKKKLIKDVSVIIIAAFVLISIPLPFLQQELKYRGNIPITNQERDLYLTKFLPSYPAYKYLNGKETGILYALYDENMNYFYKGTFIGDWFGPGRYSQITSSLSSGQALYNALKKLNANYFLVNFSRSKTILPRDQFFINHFVLEYENEVVKLYSIKK